VTSINIGAALCAYAVMALVLSAVNVLAVTEARLGAGLPFSLRTVAAAVIAGLLWLPLATLSAARAAWRIARGRA
jgi:hypothetical protein